MSTTSSTSTQIMNVADGVEVKVFESGIAKAVEDLNKAWAEKYNRKVRQLEKETAKQTEIKNAIEELNGAWKQKYTTKIEKVSQKSQQTMEEQKKEIQKLIQELNMAWDEKYQKLKTRKVLSKDVDPGEIRDAVTGLTHAWEDKYLKKVSVLKHKLAIAELTLHNPEEAVDGPYGRKAKDIVKLQQELERVTEENKMLRAKVASISALAAAVAE